LNLKLLNPNTSIYADYLGY